MMKFFRKYNKMLLAIFMVLLMIVFLGGTALDNLMRNKITTQVAESNLGDITSNDQIDAKNTTTILGSMGFNWRQPIPGASKPLELMDWILLTREARELVSEPSIESVQAWVGDAGAIDFVADVARRQRLKANRIWRAIAEYRIVVEAARAIADSTVPSAAEVRAASARVLDKIRVNAVTLPAEAFVDHQAVFTEEEMEAQWAAHRDAEPGAGLNFGYYVPPSITVQYVMIDRGTLQENIGIANLEKKARRYFNDNRTTNPAFRRPPEAAPVEEVSEDGPPQPEPDPFLSWDEAKDQAIDVVREQSADEMSGRIANWFIEHAAESWLEMERGPNRYKKVPQGVDQLDFYNDQLAQTPVSISYPDAVSTGITASFNMEGASGVPVVGSASYQPNRGRQRSFVELAFRSQAIVPEIPEELGASSAEYLATFQTCPYPLKDAAGNIFVFRVVASIPGHGAESVDEVRDRVVADLRLLQAYDMAKARGEGLRSCDSDLGLLGAFDSDDELVRMTEEGVSDELGFFQSRLIPRMRFDQVASGRTSPTVYAGLGLRQMPSEFVDAWFALEGQGPEIMEIKDRALVLVVEWAETQRGTDNEFADMREWLVNEITDGRARAAAAEWLDPDNIRARTGFKLGRR